MALTPADVLRSELSRCDPVPGGLIDTEALVDLQLPLECHEQAADALKERKADLFKVVFLPQA